jgi:hypothetical protein
MIALSFKLRACGGIPDGVIASIYSVEIAFTSLIIRGSFELVVILLVEK